MNVASLYFNDGQTIITMPPRPHTNLPPFALQMAVLDAGATLVLTVKVGRLVMVEVVRIIVYFVFVLVGVG